MSPNLCRTHVKYEKNRLTIRHLKLPGTADVLLAIVHFQSKLYWKETSQAQACVKLASEIQDIEKEIGHSRTILVGDLNMNPFEDGVISAMGLHGVMCKNVAKKKMRTIDEDRYPFFYNPMWSHFGDGKSIPPGTFYYSNAEPVVFFWNMFDQVLVRPDLLNAFSNDSLKIITSVKEIPFLSSQGRPKKKISDHLPLLFKLNL